MTLSGWVDIPRMTQYRLTAHLGLAVLIYGSVLWLAIRLIRSESRINSAWRVSPKVSITLFAVLALVFVMVLSGGLMAGTGAGLVYNTFPFMAGHWIPPDLFELHPLWRNYFENITTIQFQHRVLAMILVMVAIGLVYRRFTAKIPVLPRRLLIVLSSAIGIQFIIGIATLLNRTPVHLTLLHQCWAMVVFSIAVVICALLEPKWARAGTHNG
jgi:cytochrome c oxidase assembly protein subunit 15